MGLGAAVVAAAVVGGVASNVAANKASKAQGKASKAAIGATQQAATSAKSDVNRIFPEAQQTANLGFQGALDVFGQSVPAQMDVFQQGNVAGQQAILAGLPQQQNAILGGNVDFSGFQPFQAQTLPNNFFQQDIPGFNQQQALNNVNMNSGLGPFNPDNPLFNNQTGPFQDSQSQPLQNRFLTEYVAQPMNNQILTRRGR